MKTSFKSLLALAAIGATALISQAQTAPKILVLDMGKAIQGYYKAADMEEAMKVEGQKAQTQLQGMEKEVQDVAKKLQEIEEQAKNPALKDEAKAKFQADYEKLVQEAQAKQGEAQNYYNKVRRDMGERQQQGMNALIEDISKKGAEIAKRKGADLVLPKGTVVYNNPAWEITDEVIAELNKDKPAGSAAKPAAPAAAAPTAPASGAPTVTFPGAKK